MSDAQEGQARYLFAAARGLEPPNLAGERALRGAPLDLVDYRDLYAVVCSVDLAEFGEDQLKTNLEDLGWVEEVARTHHDVVSAVASFGAVAPMRLVTICSDDDSVRDHMEAVYPDLCEALARVEGRLEWSLKVFAAHKDQPVTVETPQPTSGAAYLERKREQAVRRQSAGEDFLRQADEIHQTLARSVAATRLLQPQDPRLSGRSEPMILNGAYLVSVGEGDGFGDLVGRLAALHPALTVELKGPWPPYSFATLD